MPTGTLGIDLDLDGEDPWEKPLAQPTLEIGPPSLSFLVGEQNCHHMEAPSLGTNMKFGEPMETSSGISGQPKNLVQPPWGEQILNY